MEQKKRAFRRLGAEVGLSRWAHKLSRVDRLALGLLAAGGKGNPAASRINHRRGDRGLQLSHRKKPMNWADGKGPVDCGSQIRPGPPIRAREGCSPYAAVFRRLKDTFSRFFVKPQQQGESAPLEEVICHFL